MNVQISYINSLSKKELTNKLFFVDQSLNIRPLKKFISSREYSYVSDLLQNLDNKKKISLFEFSSKQSIILIKLKKNIKIYPIPGVSASTTAISVSGFEDKYFFYGFLSKKEKE